MGELVLLRREPARQLASAFGVAGTLARYHALALADEIEGLGLTSAVAALTTIGVWGDQAATDLSWRVGELDRLHARPTGVDGMLSAELDHASYPEWLAAVHGGHDLAVSVDELLDDGDVHALGDVAQRLGDTRDAAFLASFYNHLGAADCVRLMTAVVREEVAYASFLGDFPDNVDRDDIADLAAVVRALSVATASGPLRDGYGGDLVEASAADGEPHTPDLVLFSLVSLLGDTSPLDVSYREAAGRAALEYRASLTVERYNPMAPTFFGAVNAILIDTARSPDASIAALDRPCLITALLNDTIAAADERGLAAVLGSATVGPVARGRLTRDPAATPVANELVTAVASAGSVQPTLRPFLAAFAVTHMADLAYAAVNLTEPGNQAPGDQQLLAIGHGEAFALIAAAMEGDDAATDRTILLGTQAYMAEVLADRMSFTHPDRAGNRAAGVLEVASLSGLVSDAWFSTDMDVAERAQARAELAYGLLAGATNILTKQVPGGPVVGFIAGSFRDAVIADLVPDHVGVTEAMLADAELTTSFQLQRAVTIAYYEAAVDAVHAGGGVTAAARAEAEHVVEVVSAYDAQLPEADRFLDPDTGHLLAEVGEPGSTGRPAEAFDQIARTPPPELAGFAAVVLPLGADAAAIEQAASTDYRR